MKNLLSLFIIGLAFTLNASAQRFGTTPNRDNTGGVLVYKTASPSLGSTDSIAPDAFESFYKVAVAGAKTIHIRSTYAKTWDRCHIEFTADGTTRLMTLTGTAMLSDINRDTISVMSSRKSWVSFYYNGTKWVQYNRYQQH